MTGWESPNWDNQESLMCDATHLLLMLISSLLLQGMSFQSVLWQQIIEDYLRNAILFHVYECIIRCGVHMLADFSIILQSFLTEGKDTTDPTPQLGIPTDAPPCGWCLGVWRCYQKALLVICGFPFHVSVWWKAGNKYGDLRYGYI